MNYISKTIGILIAALSLCFFTPTPAKAGCGLTAQITSYSLTRFEDSALVAFSVTGKGKWVLCAQDLDTGAVTYPCRGEITRNTDLVLVVDAPNGAAFHTYYYFVLMDNDGWEVSGNDSNAH